MQQLSNRNYTLIIDRSGSMMTADQAGGRSRWVTAQESTLALAAKCEQFDPDGITVYLFSGKHKRFDNVTSAKVSQIFTENEPVGGTNLAGVLQHAFDGFFANRASAQGRPETILVITDGEPDDQRAVMKVIVEATRKMTEDGELALSIIQVGKDESAKRFLKILDDELPKAGAKFDICDTITMDDLEDMTISEVLLNAISD
jgi:uncharacterized protein with von Willebrand factor type A (vWA) domain